MQKNKNFGKKYDFVLKILFLKYKYLLIYINPMKVILKKEKNWWQKWQKQQAKEILETHVVKLSIENFDFLTSELYDSEACSPGYKNFLVIKLHRVVKFL